jgi:hypothetical protein
MIGLIGAHRVGKSYLVKELSRGPFHELDVSISKWQKELGYDSSNMNYSWSTRQDIQLGLLRKFAEVLRDSHRQIIRAIKDTTKVITERTPLDLIGYAYLNAPANPSESDMKWLYAYATQCILLTNEYYDQVILIQPGIEFVHDPKSASEDSVEILNAHYQSVLMDSRLEPKKFIMDRTVTDIRDRVTYVLGAVNVHNI